MYIFFTFLILSSACPPLSQICKGIGQNNDFALPHFCITFGCSSFLSFSLSGIPALASRCWGYVSGSKSHHFFQQWPCLAILCPHHLFKAGQVRYIWLPCGSQKEEFWHKTVWRVKQTAGGEERLSSTFCSIISTDMQMDTHISTWMHIHIATGDFLAWQSHPSQPSGSLFLCTAF